MIETLTTLTFLSIMAYLIYSIVRLSRQAEGKFDYRVYGLIFVVAFILGFAPVMGYGVFRAWYLSTGWKEVNHPYPKAQEAPYQSSVAGTINDRGLPPDATTRDRSRKLKNPLPATSQAIREGKTLFMNYCKPCHGETGEGEGVMGSVPMLKSKAPEGEAESLAIYLSNFTGFKPQIDMKFVQNSTDGDIYYTITNGGESIMPSFEDALYPKDRWKIVHYIKRELSKE